MGEHLPCKQGVKGSIPFISTIPGGKTGEGSREERTKDRESVGS